jgi:peptide/nickel transport system substrate-binding protein
VIPNGIGIGNPASPTDLTPLIGVNEANLQGGLLLYRPLVWPGPDAVQDAARSLAARIDVLDNATRFRVTLKPWRWSDGVPLTAADVVFGWREIEALGQGFAYYGQGGIPARVKRVQAVGPLSVDFVLAGPANAQWFELNGLSVVFPLPEHAWRGADAATLWAHQTDADFVRVVDGPFRLTDFRLDRYAAYAPNALYGGKPAHLARLVVTFLEGDSPLHAVEAGDADLAIMPSQLWTRVPPGGNFHTVTLPEPYGEWALTANLSASGKAFFRDAAVRRALAQAIDQGAIIRLVFHGLSHENHVPIPVAAQAWRSAMTRAGDTAEQYDPAAAAAALDAAGWRLGADGVRARGGARLAFTVLDGAASEDAAEMQVLLLVQRDLARLGVDMRLRRMGFDELLATLADPAAWDAALVAQTQPPVPDGSGVLDTGSAGNLGFYSDPTMDRLIAASTSQTGQAALFAYQDYAAAQEPWIILPQGELPLLVADRLHGARSFSSPIGYWTPEDLWVDDAACHDQRIHDRGAAALR